MITRAGALARETVNAVELELRRIDGVVFTGFAERDDALVAQLVVSSNTDLTQVRITAERVCRAYVDRPVVIELAGGTRAARVRLLDVQSFDVGEGEIEVRLGFEGMQTVGRARGGDPVAAAAATFEALAQLGAQVPFEVKAAALFEHAVGEGVMLVFDSPSAGERYGVASGDSLEQAAARATLHALNRYLAAQALSA